MGVPPIDIIDGDDKKTHRHHSRPSPTPMQLTVLELIEW